jgi:hypothetical protein
MFVIDIAKTVQFPTKAIPLREEIASKINMSVNFI